MNAYELQMLNSIDEIREELITIDHLSNQDERTLLYGCDYHKNTVHTYIKNGEIKTVVYEHTGKLRERLVGDNKHYIPNRRLYPECCDYEFCKLLMLKDIYLPFTVLRERENKKYYGKIL